MGEGGDRANVHKASNFEWRRGMQREIERWEPFPTATTLHLDNGRKNHETQNALSKESRNPKCTFERRRRSGIKKKGEVKRRRRGKGEAYNPILVICRLSENFSARKWWKLRLGKLTGVKLSHGWDCCGPNKCCRRIIPSLYHPSPPSPITNK